MGAHAVCVNLLRVGTKNVPILRRWDDATQFEAAHVGRVIQFVFIKLATRGGTIFVDSAGDFFADFAAQRNATRRIVVGPFHAQQMLVHLLGKLLGHETIRRLIGFAPVERDTEIGAAGTAG